MRILLLIALCIFYSNSAFASRFPPGSNVVDPRNYGAVPNDGLPDTAAFQAAERDSVLYGHIYEITGNPGDVYTIDAPIKSQILHGSPPTLKWVNNWIVLCDPGVIIQVPDNTPAFNNAASPQAVFEYGSTTLASPTAPPASGGGNEGYRNTFDGSCIIDTGHNNPGARAISWVVNNRGVIRDITIRSGDGLGNTGIWMGRPWPGPGLIENVTIQGFDRAVWDGYVQYGIVYKNMHISGQRIFGLDITADASTVEGLHSCNTVPAIRTESSAGQVVVIDSKFDCGLSNKSAISLSATSKAYIRDSSASGYQSLVKQGTNIHTDLGLQVTEWTSHPEITRPGTAGGSLRLPALEAPKSFTSNNPNDWADPRSYGANPNDKLDDRANILAAIATGKPILQLVQGHAGGSTAAFQSTYYVSDTIDIPCSVRRIEGMESKLVTTTSFPVGHPLIRFADNCDWSDTTVVERLWPGGKGGPMYEHSDARTLYLKDVYAAAGSTGISNLLGAGFLFLKNVVASGLILEGGQAWAWQFNPENFNETVGVINNGAIFRVVGMKTEGLGRGGKPTLTTKNNGATEIIGGLMMPCVGMGTLDVELGFVVEDSDFSAVYTNWCGKDFDRATWDVQIRDTQNGDIYEVYPEQLPTYTVEGGNKVFMSLYSSRKAPICEQ